MEYAGLAFEVPSFAKIDDLMAVSSCNPSVRAATTTFFWGRVNARMPSWKWW